MLYGKKGLYKCNGIIKFSHFGFINMKMRDPNFTYVCETLDMVFREHPDWDCVKIYYNIYHNQCSHEMTIQSIYNAGVCEEIAKVQFPSYELEGDEGIILQNLLEHKIANSVYLGLAENAACEQGARLTSMDGAVTACKEKSEEYNKIYMKLRKTKITSELVILSAGVACLKTSSGEGGD